MTAHHRSHFHRDQQLTLREREVAGLLADCMPQREIARTLGISYETVRTHINRAKEKLELHSTCGLAAYAWKARRQP